jgi:phosphatidylglycerophosphatase A
MLPLLVALSLVMHITPSMPLSFSLSFFLFWFVRKDKKEKERKEDKRFF